MFEVSITNFHTSPKYFREAPRASEQGNFWGAGPVLPRKFGDVTDWRWWLFRLLVDFYNFTGVVLVSLLLCLLAAGDSWYKFTWAHRAQCSFQSTLGMRDYLIWMRSDQGRGPKNITENSQNQGFWKFWSIAAERLVCCCVWMRTLAVSFYSLAKALDQLAVT